MPYDVYFRFSVGHGHKTLVLKTKHNKIRKRRTNYKIRMVRRKNVGKKKKFMDVRGQSPPVISIFCIFVTEHTGVYL